MVIIIRKGFETLMHGSVFKQSSQGWLGRTWSVCVCVLQSSIYLSLSLMDADTILCLCDHPIINALLNRMRPVCGRGSCSALAVSRVHFWLCAIPSSNQPLCENKWLDCIRFKAWGICTRWQLCGRHFWGSSVLEDVMSPHQTEGECDPVFIRHR